MALLKSKPTSPGKRGEIRVVHHHIHKGKPHAALVEKLKKTGGRNELLLGI
jgi:large subunit ribosomal protein L2